MASANIPLPEQGEAATPTYPFLHNNGDGSYTYRSDAPADIWSFLDAIGDDPQLALRVTVLQLTLEYDGAVDSGVLDYVDDEAVLMNTTPQAEQDYESYLELDEAPEAEPGIDEIEDDATSTNMNTVEEESEVDSSLPEDQITNVPKATTPGTDETGYTYDEAMNISIAEGHLDPTSSDSSSSSSQSSSNNVTQRPTVVSSHHDVPVARTDHEIKDRLQLLVQDIELIRSGSHMRTKYQIICTSRCGRVC